MLGKLWEKIWKVSSGDFSAAFSTATTMNSGSRKPFFQLFSCLSQQFGESDAALEIFLLFLLLVFINFPTLFEWRDSSEAWKIDENEEEAVRFRVQSGKWLQLSVENFISRSHWKFRNYWTTELVKVKQTTAAESWKFIDLFRIEIHQFCNSTYSQGVRDGVRRLEWIGTKFRVRHAGRISRSRKTRGARKT